MAHPRSSWRTRPAHRGRPPAPSTPVARARPRAGGVLLAAWVAHRRPAGASGCGWSTSATSTATTSSTGPWPTRTRCSRPTTCLDEPRRALHAGGAAALRLPRPRRFPLDWTAVTVVLLVAAAARLVRGAATAPDGHGRPTGRADPARGRTCSRPLGLGSLTWWAAAMNAVPLQIGLAWYVAEAVRLARTGRRRGTPSRGTLALVLALAFYQRPCSSRPLAGAVVWLLNHGLPRPRAAALGPARRAARCGCRPWRSLAGWAWLTCSADPGAPRGDHAHRRRSRS